MPSAFVDGITLHYVVEGAGPAVLVIPGLGSDVRMFSWLVTAAADRRLVVAFDPRGSGLSDKPDPPYSIDQMADDAIGVLDAAGVGAATVMGYSMGGRIALSLAVRHAARVHSLVLAATSARTVPTTPFTRRWLAEMLGLVPLPRSVDPQPRDAHRAQRVASRQYDATSLLGRITVPTTVVHAMHDHITPYRLAQELALGIAGARLVRVPGGHFSLLTRSRRTLLHAVLAASEPPGGT